jgi:signal transduction histidine kinase
MADAVPDADMLEAGVPVSGRPDVVPDASMSVPGMSDSGRADSAAGNAGVATPDAVLPDAVLPGTVVADSAASDGAAADATAPDPTVSDPTVSDPTAPDPTVSDPTASDATAPDVGTSDPARSASPTRPGQLDRVGTAGYDELPDGVVVAGADGRVEVLNAAGGRLLGVDPRAGVGQDYRDVLPLTDLAGRDWWACTDPYRGLDIRTGQPERVLELHRGPRRGRQLLVTARYVRDGGRLARLIVAFRDTRARERADRDRADVVSAVAHEIRSPLTTVKGFTATVLAKWDRLTDDQKRTMLRAVEADADRVTRLLSDLLDVSRIDAGRLTLHPQVVDLPAAVERVLAGRVASGDSVDRFDLRVTSLLPETWLDPDRVAQVLGNLVENAVRHGAGQVSVTVTAGSTLAGAPAAVLTVADQGAGIRPEVRPRIFRPFWRGDRAGGSGLGLHIVKGLVEAHGGTVDVDEAPGGGARFRVVFPAGAPPYQDPLSAS